MSSDVPPIARIKLARSVRRLMAVPLLLVLIGAAAAAGAWRADGPAVIALAIAGTGIMLGGLAVAAVLLSVRVDVTEAGIRLRWLGGERTYVLARGAVTRVALRGRNASPLRARLGAFGWALGAARLRGSEAIETVLMAPAASAIVVPTEQRRLAIAVADEQQLLDAVASAARARQRLEDLSRRARPMHALQALEPVEGVERPAALEGVEAGEPAEAGEPLEAPRRLTGIERAQLEERLAAERAAAAAANAAAAAASVAAPDLGPAEAAPVSGAPTRARRVRRPLPRPGARVVALLLPALAAGAVWGAILLSGRLAEADPGRLRLAEVALVLAGPGAAVGALMARVWWPRLMGVVAVTALCALLVAGQALLLD